MFSHEKHPAAEAEQALSGKTAEPAPSVDQLWSVIEFFRQFPDLTMCLVTDLNNADLADEQQQKQLEAALDELCFPDLAVPDPRELRMQKKQQELSSAPVEEIPFLADEMPPPGGQSRKTLWRHLLSLFSMAAFLLWLSLPL